MLFCCRFVILAGSAAMLISFGPSTTTIIGTASAQFVVDHSNHHVYTAQEVRMTFEPLDPPGGTALGSIAGATAIYSSMSSFDDTWGTGGGEGPERCLISLRGSPSKRVHTAALVARRGPLRSL